jgi:ABC-type transport system substrate-binding protein
MGISFGRATRITAFAAVLIVVMLLGAPVLQLGGKTVSVSPVKNVAAANGSRVFSVGQVDYMGGMASLNPFLYTQAEEMETLWPCYSTLVMYDRDLNYVGDLARSWTVSTDGLTWNFKLVNNAYFVDGRLGTTPAQIAAANKIPSHLVTAADVMFTYWEVNNNTANHLNSYLNNGYEGIIESMTNTTRFDLTIKTKTPYAPLLSGMTMIPIVPLYYWFGKAVMRFANDPPIGSGYMYFGMSGVPTTIGILKRNPIWFQEENRGWQVHVDTLLYKNEGNSATAWTELTTPTPLIDCLLQVEPALYKNNIVDTTTPYVMGFGAKTGFVYEYQLNQMTTAERAGLGLDKGGAYNNQLLLDPTVKLAMAMSVNKQQFVDDVLLGFGSVADSLIVDTSKWHYTYPTPVVFDTGYARSLLNAAGWAFDSTGADDDGTAVPLYKKTGTVVYDPLSFRLLSLTPEPQWDSGTRLIAQWAAEAGIQLNIDLMSTNQANTAWYVGDYDTWLWDWAFSPTSDPSTDCMSVHTTGAIGSWSGSYWSNKTYDDLYNRSLLAIDETTRKTLVDEMQKVLYEDHAAQYVAFRQDLYAVNYKSWDRASYGNWATGTGWMLMPDFYQPFLYMQLSPPVTDNMAPTASVEPTFEGFMGESIPFTGTGSDGSGGTGLEYQWYWGDDTPNTGWQSSHDASHPFAQDGVYTVYFAARETGTADGFSGWNKTTVTVYDKNNAPPTTPTIVPSTTTPDMGDVITFTGSSTDTDPLYYTWNFGDTYTALGSVVTHAYTTSQTFTVSLDVTDNHPGAGRPAHNTYSLDVAFNGPPVLSLPSSRTVNWKTVVTYTATASDPESDPMRFTWVWDDGSTSVTTTSTTTHEYTQKGRYGLVVHADDLTGLAGHNVSALENVTVIGPLSPPTTLTLSADLTSALVGQTIVFTGSAKDPDVDQMRFWFSFGDGSPNGTWAYVDGPVPSHNNQLVTVTTSHAYQTLGTGTMTVFMYVYDGQSNTTSSQLLITLTQNDPPQVAPVTDVTGTVGLATPFSVSAYEPDSDTLLYTWDFGDGTPLESSTLTSDTTHTYLTSGTYIYTVYVDDQTGITSHNVSSSANAIIAGVARPVAVAGPDQIIDLGDLVTFGGTGSNDPDGVIVAWYWTFTYDGVAQNLSGETQSFPFLTVPGVVVVTLTVVDNDGMVGTDTMTVTIVGPIPEFPTVLLPVAGILALVVLFEVVAPMRRRREP